MKGTSPLFVYCAYLATMLFFEAIFSTYLSATGLSPYRSEKIGILLAATLLIATHQLHYDPGQTKIAFNHPSAAHYRRALLFSLPLAITGMALIGVQVFLAAQISESRAASLWNFTGHPGAVGFYNQYFGSKSGVLNLTLFASTQFIVMPLIEEIYFKGIILEKFLAKYSVNASILATSTLFAIAHENRMFISVFTFSVFTCLYYRYCRNIWVLTSIHGLGNFLDWLYSGFGGITFLEARTVDELRHVSAWDVDIAVAVVSCLTCCIFLIRLLPPTPPSPSPASAAPDRHPS